MNRYYKNTIKAASLPVTVEEVKSYSRVLHDVEDSLITSFINSAVNAIENYLHKSLITQTWELVYNSFPETVIKLPRCPIQSVTDIKYYDTENTETIYDSSNYFVDINSEPGTISLNYNVTWPTTTLRPSRSLVITYITGYGNTGADVPDLIKDAIYLYCNYRYENRIAEDGTIPEAFFNILKPERLNFY